MPVVATCQLPGLSTWRAEELVKQLGSGSWAKSQVLEIAAHLDAQVEAFRNRTSDLGHQTFV
jgi:Transposase, Mutator family.